MKLIEFETAYEMVRQYLNIVPETHKSELSEKDHYMSLVIGWHGVSEEFYGWVFPSYTRGEAETNNSNYIKLGGGPVLITRWGELLLDGENFGTSAHLQVSQSY